MAATAAIMKDPNLAIDLRDVDKVYKGKVHALRGIDMRIHRGEVFGLLGPNGAGKSTLVKILMTVIRPTRCAGTILDSRVGDKATLARVGYLPEHHTLPGHLTGRQVVDFIGAMARVPRRERKRRADTLLERVGIGDWADKRVRGYSKGMRQRLGVAQALVNEPDLVLLDEPTDGVDPVGRREIRDLVAELREEGKTVFINSHLLSELEMVCDRVAILVQGVVARQGTLEQLTEGKRRYEIELATEPDDAREAFRAALPDMLSEGLHDALPPCAAHGDEGAVVVAGQSPPTRPAHARRVGYAGNLPTGERLEIEKRTLRVGTTDPNVIQPILDALRKRNQTIREVRQHRPTLEDLFIEAVTDPETGKTLLPGARADEKKGRRR